MAIFKPIRQFFKKLHLQYEVHPFKRWVFRSNHLRIVVGSGGIYYKGWISTDIENLNLLKINNWQKYFKSESIDAILAEHVWEHLTEEEGTIAAKNCYYFLKPGGYLRVAVPDGYNPSPAYIQDVKINGRGFGASDHKVLYNYQTFTYLFSKIGFSVVQLEYFDSDGKFHFTEWDPEKGQIYRSKLFDKRNNNGIIRYNSIILDCYK
jgi:predicted SAM-dependent methyltransferase